MEQRNTDDYVPAWERELLRKHRHQLRMHEESFGKLGELQSPEQKKALKAAVKAESTTRRPNGGKK